MNLLHERLFMFDLHRLRLLRELRNRGSLAAVAEALGYNPSSVSHQLTILKREAGTEIFEPQGRSVRLTAAGEMLADSAERLLRELEAVQAQVASLSSEVSGTVRIAAFQTASHALLPGVISQLTRNYPLLKVTFRQLQAEQALPALLAHDFELVICEEYPGNPLELHPGIINQTLVKDSLWLATPEGQNIQSLSECVDHDWIMEPEGTRARTWAVAQCRSAGFEPKVVYETSDVYAHKRFVDTGLATAFLPQFILGNNHRHLSTESHRRISIATRNGAQEAPSLNAVKNALLEFRGND